MDVLNKINHLTYHRLPWNLCLHVQSKNLPNENYQRMLNLLSVPNYPWPIPKSMVVQPAIKEIFLNHTIYQACFNKILAGLNLEIIESTKNENGFHKNLKVIWPMMKKIFDTCNENQNGTQKQHTSSNKKLITAFVLTNLVSRM